MGRLMRIDHFGSARRLLAVLVLILGSFLTMADDWPTYMHDTMRTGASQSESSLTTGNVPQLVKLWSYKTGQIIAAQPIIVNGTVYVGSWDGYEYALNATTGALLWKTFLGTTSAPCSIQGVTSAPAVQNGVLYLGGGDSYWYALNATTGAILWKVFTGDNSAAGGHYNWASPLIYNGYAYIGIASLCDTPLVQGQLLQVSLSTHQIVNTANMAPNGQVGGGIWTTPAVDPATNTIYVTTGTNGVFDSTQQPLTLAMVALDASTLAIDGSWQIPFAQQTSDSDWGNTPVLFDDASGRHLVAAVNKNGYLYAFDRTNLGAGPVWQTAVTVSGPDPVAGDGTVSTGAFGNGLLYMAGGNTTISGMPYAGSVRAFDPATGKIVWEHGTSSPIISSIAYANGMVFAGGGKYGTNNYVEVLSASTGARLYSYYLTGSVFSLSVANGQVYAGSTDGNLYVLGLPNPPATATATPLPDGGCPSAWLCQDIGGAVPAGSDSASGGTFSVSGGGAGIAGMADQFRYLSQSVSGDAQISAQVLSQSGSGSTAMAGLMVRQSSDPAAAYYAAFLSPGAGLVVQYRGQPGATTSTAVTAMSSAAAPLYLRIQRLGDSFTTATSSDGQQYTLVPGSQATVVLPGGVLSGLAVTSGSATQTNAAQFGTVALGAPSTPPVTPTPLPDAACPAGWNCQDIGNFVPSGNESTSGNTWTVQAAGQDIGGAADQFRFIWQSLTGDGVVSAHVASQTNTNSYAKSGVMIRGGTDPSAPFYAAYVTPGAGVIVQDRLTQGAFTRIAATVAGAAPLYVRVRRNGNAFMADTSTDGVTWTLVAGSDMVIGMASGTLAGLAATSHAPGVLLMAQLDSVSVTPTTPACTSPSTATPTPTLAATYCSYPPTTWTPNQTQVYAITVTNTGTQTWNATGANPFHLGVEFGGASDAPGSGWATDQRFSLIDGNVPPGGSLTVIASVTAPATTGSYVLRHRMVEENVSWFGDIQKTNVTIGSGATPTSTPTGVATNTTTSTPAPPTATPTNTPTGTATSSATNTPAPPTATASGTPAGPTPTATPTAGGALSASYAVSPPTTWFNNQAQTYSVTVTNTGTQTWSAAGASPVHLGVSFGGASDAPGAGWAIDDRFSLPGDVPPGGSATFAISVAAPDAGGPYVLRHRMVEENVAWFNQMQRTSLTVGSLAAGYAASPPASWSPGQTILYQVTLTNTGTVTWNAGGANPVRLGVSFGGSSDVPGAGWATDQRFALPADVPPGGSTTFTINVTAPATAGPYVLRHRMVKEQVAWFDQLTKTNVAVGSAATGSATSTPAPPTATATYSVTSTPTAAQTNTAVPPSATATRTPAPSTATATRSPTNTLVPPTATLTGTPTVSGTPAGPTPTATPTAGGALSASYAVSPPTTWFNNQAQTYSVTVTNTGTQTWNATGANPVHLGVSFGGASDAPGAGWAIDDRFSLPADVPPGGSATLTVTVTAPDAGGPYVLRHRMVEENVAWFNQMQRTGLTVGSLAASYSASPPTSWSPGQTQTYAVTVTNTGTVTWNASGANPVHLGVSFGGSSDAPDTGWATDQRFALPADVPPGGSATFVIAVTAPATAGPYVLRHRMVKEQVAWFDQLTKTNVTVG